VATRAPEPGPRADAPGAERRRSPGDGEAILAVLGHELRNPLAPMRNAVHLLRRPDLPAETRERALAILQRQLDHLTRLVGDLVDGSRLARGRVQLRDEEVDLARVVRDEGEDLRGLCEERGVELLVHVPPRAVPVRGDAVRLAQVVSSLVQNAVRFSDRGSRVTVRLDVAPRGSAALRVVDTGIGMSAHTLARLFQPFATADRSLARTRGGLGVGLTVVKGLVELHGGTIRGESAGPGAGSTFTVELPLSPAADPSPCAGSERDVPRAVRRVLVVEDNADSAMTLSELLALRGHEVALAADGPSALEAVRRSRPDVVVCDVGLPGELDGYGVARAIRADPALGGLVLIALSGYTTPEHCERALQAGFDAHLAKPADFDELCRLIEDPAARALPNGA
jgi:CheY-like chemotaxis protein